jgi:hypothetical protein
LLVLEVEGMKAREPDILDHEACMLILKEKNGGHVPDLQRLARNLAAKLSRARKNNPALVSAAKKLFADRPALKKLLADLDRIKAMN